MRVPSPPNPDRRDRIIISPALLHPTPGNFAQLDILALPDEMKKPFEDAIDMAEKSMSRTQGNQVHIDRIASQEGVEIAPSNWSVYLHVHFDNGTEVQWIMTAEYDDPTKSSQMSVTIHQNGELLCRGEKPTFSSRVKIATGVILEKSKDILQQLILQRARMRSDQTNMDTIRAGLNI